MTPVSEDEKGGIVTACHHVFCRTCIDEVIAKDQVEDHDDDPKAIKYKADQRPCPKYVFGRSSPSPLPRVHR